MDSPRQLYRGESRWFYPVVYLLFVIINFLPLYTQQPYSPQETQKVIWALLSTSIAPYAHIGWLFHVATILLVLAIIRFKERAGHWVAAYMGLNYLLIAFLQTMGKTPAYGFVIHTGALVTALVLGIVWLLVAVRGGLETSFSEVPRYRYLLLPLVLLAYWAPHDANVQPDFSPMLLLTSPDYGLAFCFTTPVFLFLLILFYPRVDSFAYRITAFNGLLFGLFNMSHFFTPELVWMGVLHLPLLLLSMYALFLLRSIPERR